MLNTQSFEGHKIDSIKIGSEWFIGIGYQGLLNVNTKTYVEEPTRANDGSMPNINDHDTFVVPRCKVNFKYFKIEDYQRLCRVVSSANEFPVTFWDKQFGEWVTHNMYVEPEEMAKMFNVGTSVFGVLDYEISFIGTLNNLKTFKISYNAGEINNIVPTIKGYVGEYNKELTYHKDNVVSRDRKYYIAIFYEDTFKEKSVTDTVYWNSISPTLYSSETAYTAGNIVYTTYEQNEETKYNFYIALAPNTDRPTTDTSYWKLITVNKYNPKSTYKKGQYVHDGNSTTTIYEAIFYNDQFIGKDVYDTKYWANSPINAFFNDLGGLSVNWGNSVQISSVDELFTVPSIDGITFKGWKTDKGLWYQPNQSVNVFNDLIMTAQWEIV